MCLANNKGYRVLCLSGGNRKFTVKGKMEMKKVKSKLLKASFMAMMIITGCRMPTQGENGTNTFSKKNFPPLTDSDTKITHSSKIVAANNKFGFKLFSDLLKTDKNKNIFISPTSILFALSMTYNGANGDTKDAMAKALELKDLSQDEVNKESNALIRTLINLDPQVRLDIANSLWGRKGIDFAPDFIKNNENYFKATVNSLDFNSTEASKTINNWVSENTQKKIEKIVPDTISAETILFLINAIYFKGTWTDKFDKTLTKERPFTLTDGKQKNFQMMNRYDDFRYLKEDNFQAVSLPYGNENLSMYVLLPDKDAKLEDFLKSLTAENIDKWVNQFSKNKGDVVLPRFKLEYEADLNDSLKTLGMETAFSDKADFKNMVTGSLKPFISNVKHKTFVEVNEEGTEAAAVTSVTVGATSVQIPKEPFKMIVDHPFFI